MMSLSEWIKHMRERADARLEVADDDPSLLHEEDMIIWANRLVTIKMPCTIALRIPQVNDVFSSRVVR